MGYREIILADNPTAYWRLGETPGAPTSQDETLHNNDGTYSGGTLGVAGALVSANTALAMDGNDKVVLPPGIMNLATSTSPKSVECWFQTSAATAALVCARDDIDGNPVLDVVIGNNGAANLPGKASLLVRADNNTGLTHFHTSNRYDDGQWHHLVAVIRADKTMNLYLDGASDGGATHSMTVGATMDVPLIGDEQLNGAILNLVGSIDEVAIYDLALSNTQISAHYEARLLADLAPELVVMSRTNRNGRYPVIRDPYARIKRLSYPDR